MLSSTDYGYIYGKVRERIGESVLGFKREGSKVFRCLCGRQEEAPSGAYLAIAEYSSIWSKRAAARRHCFCCASLDLRPCLSQAM